MDKLLTALPQGGDFSPELLSSLKAGNTQLFIDFAQEPMAHLIKDDKQKRMMLSSLKMLNGMPKENWLQILFPFMKSLISCQENGKTVFFDESDFPWINEVENRWLAITREVNTALKGINLIPAFQEIQEDQSALTRDDLWKVIVFRGFGDDIKKNSDAFPETFSALNVIPGWASGMISILQPGKKIPPHTGLYNGVLRYHLGLKIPENCAIRVDGITREWAEGKSLVFDDTFEHEAWNLSDSTRAVLFVDFLRPLAFPFNVMNEFIAFHLIKETSFIKNAKKNYDKFDDLLEMIQGEI